MILQKAAVFASGTGSNFQAIINQKDLPCEICLLVCDMAEAPVIEKARQKGISIYLFDPKSYPSKQDYEKEILRELHALGIEWIFLAGYMRLIGSTLLNVFTGKILNIHPSMLPNFPGLDAIGQALEAGVSKTGVTVHFVDEGMDTGPVIIQESVPVLQGDTKETLTERIQRVEHRLYVKAIQLVINKEGFSMKKTALISVSDKTNVVSFAEGLLKLDYKIISTGGTLRLLKDAGLQVTSVEEVTGFPEILDGRVKTLHPKIHAGLLAKSDDLDHQKQLEEHHIESVDLVAVNLYPFKQTLDQVCVTEEEIIENIDIGGPTMLRAAAKNCSSVTVIVDPSDYMLVLEELQKEEWNIQKRKKLAAKVFRHTAQYDALIADYFTKETGDEFPESFTVTYEKVQSLRYGENPHQQAAFYKNLQNADTTSNLTSAKQLHGKELSYNNIQDASSALEIISEYKEPAAVAVKHMNPCGIGVGESVVEAFDKAYAADSKSIFGGIVVLNREVSEAVAEKLHKIFLEIVIAPKFSEGALAVLKQKKNIRLLEVEMTDTTVPYKKLTSVKGGMLLQDADLEQINVYGLTFTTRRKPTEKELADLLFAWKAVKHVKSNAIVLAKDEQTIGIGAGQMNRVGAAEIAIEQAGVKAKEAVMASDAFFPMPDTVEAAVKAGVTAIIQPGGSKRDQDSIDLCNKHGIAMVFTNQRHFKH